MTHLLLLALVLVAVVGFAVGVAYGFVMARTFDEPRGEK